ncbi:hypothetical protein SAY87_016114 [Trapa incisa]|uniref:Uncharacterized protein n=1 Tax=Trapa incisa TaxID=236973 RepID=A0AAN7LBX1_9MYRT|nr:hypothetical protein SAY87_016114 [Trapa incisa]
MKSLEPGADEILEAARQADVAIVGTRVPEGEDPVKGAAKEEGRYMQEGAEAVHAANPDLLVIVSGLHHDRNFDFLIDQPLNLTFSRNLVFELHWYASSTGGRRVWSNHNANEVCRSMADEIMGRA